MPVRLLSAAEHDRLSRFPAEVLPEDLAAYATLSDADLNAVRVQRGDTNQLGFAVQLVALRFLGFVPDDVGATPEPVVRHLAKQVGADASAITEYGGRFETVRGHQALAMDHLGTRRATASEIGGLEDWLVARALEHDRPSVLVGAACDKLKRDRLLRPGLTVIERAVATARRRAHEETYHRLRSVLTPVVEAMLDELLVPDAEGEMTTLGWLRKRASTETPAALLDTLAKVEWLREQGVDQWDLSAVGPNRLKLLAGLGRRYTNQALQRAVPERRYPVLAALLQRTLREATDEAVDLYDALIAGVLARSRRALRAHDESVARSTEDKARLFHEFGLLVLDPDVSNADLRAEIFRWLPPLEFAAAVDEAGRIVHPEGQAFFAYLDARYGYVRQFAPAFLNTMALRSNRPDDPVVVAVEILRRLNHEGRRKMPAGVPTTFVEKRWRPFVFENGKTDGLVNRHGWELAALAALRDRLRSGDVYTEPSARYADPESYLIPEDAWPGVRDEACAQLGLTASGQERVAERVRELRGLLSRVDVALDSGDRGVRAEDGHIVVPPFDAESLPPSAAALATSVTDRLPLVDLPDLLIEVDAWTGFSRHLTHGGVTPHAPDGDALRHLYAVVLAQACNVPFTDMAQSADLAYDRLHYASTWHLRKETLTSATDTLVNHQYRQPLAALWGSGTLSSSDGQRFPVRGKVRGATAIPRYFGYGRGITFYTWTSDQYSQYGTKVISTTVRDATYVLDEILDNETDLDVLEHTTDHAGYTDLVFALFDLLGMRFSPRLRDLGDTRVYRATGGLVGDFERYPALDGVLRGRVDLDRIAAGWDDLLRVAWSLKSGHVTASLLVSKLQARPRQGRLTRLLQEYGRLAKTLHVLRCLESEAHRRRIGAQLNKGERLHQLRAWLTFGGDGKLRRKTEEGQSEQARCLNLVTNAVVVWNTRYITAVADALRAEGQEIRDQDLAHLSPTRFEHVNRYGRYRFDVDGAPQAGLRPLREP